MRKYMVIERYKAGSFDAVYARFQTQGRLLPDGLTYLNSWVNREANLCFQLMETEAPELFTSWFARWNDLVDFELFEID
jgi:hypothetical protein